jgi:hypothetical protein
MCTKLMMSWYCWQVITGIVCIGWIRLCSSMYVLWAARGVREGNQGMAHPPIERNERWSGFINETEGSGHLVLFGRLDRGETPRWLEQASLQTGKASVVTHPFDAVPQRESADRCKCFDKDMSRACTPRRRRTAWLQSRPALLHRRDIVTPTYVTIG